MKKKNILLIFITVMLLCSVNVSAASQSKTRVNKAYTAYIKRNLSSSERYPYARYTLYDINRDGTPELFFEYMSGRRSGFKIYTYKNKKVVELKSATGVSRIYYKGGKKQICILNSAGFADNTYTYYKLRNGKLKKVSQYKSKSSYSVSTGRRTVKFYKNRKRISQKTYTSNTNLDAVWGCIQCYKKVS